MTYAYDALGNRLSETQSGVTLEHSYGTTSNRQLTAAGSSIGYDASGNRVSDGNGARTFTYDVRNRLRHVTANGTTVGTYTVNALGQRVRKVAGSADVDAVYDLSGHLIGEYANGTLIREYVYLDDLPIAQIESGGTGTYLHPDHLGTPRTGTDANAQIVWRWDGDLFGEAAPNEDPDGDMTDVTVNLRFPGQYLDVETGLHYNYFRDYDPSVGRYVQSDPIGLRGGNNRYSYALSSPANHSDRLGLDVSLVCRQVEDWRTDWLGPFRPVHCAVIVWHVNDCGGERIVDSQYSYGGLPDKLTPNKPTYEMDREVFNGNRDGFEFTIRPPAGMSTTEFDAAVTRSGDYYVLPGPYRPVPGPNSNTAADDIVEASGGTMPTVPFAWGQSYGE